LSTNDSLYFTVLEIIPEEFYLFYIEDFRATLAKIVKQWKSYTDPMQAPPNLHLPWTLLCILLTELTNSSEKSSTSSILAFSLLKCIRLDSPAYCHKVNDWMLQIYHDLPLSASDDLRHFCHKFKDISILFECYSFIWLYLLKAEDLKSIHCLIREWLARIPQDNKLSEHERYCLSYFCAFLKKLGWTDLILELNTAMKDDEAIRQSILMAADLGHLLPISSKDKSIEGCIYDIYLEGQDKQISLIHLENELKAYFSSHCAPWINQSILFARYCMCKAIFHIENIPVAYYFMLAGHSVLEPLWEHHVGSFITPPTAATETITNVWEVYYIYIEYMTFLLELALRSGLYVDAQYYSKILLSILEQDCENVSSSSLNTKAAASRSEFSSKAAEENSSIPIPDLPVYFSWFKLLLDYREKRFDSKPLDLLEKFPKKFFHKKYIRLYEAAFEGKPRDALPLLFEEVWRIKAEQLNWSDARAVDSLCTQLFCSSSINLIQDIFEHDYIINENEKNKMRDIIIGALFHRDRFLFDILKNSHLNSSASILERFTMARDVKIPKISLANSHSIISEYLPDYHQVLTLFIDSSASCLTLYFYRSSWNKSFSVSLTRFGSSYSYSKMIEAFDEIMKENSYLTSSKYMNDISTASGQPSLRSSWWQQRERLDSQIKDFVISLERYWLGAFKYFLLPQDAIHPMELDVFTEKILKFKPIKRDQLSEESVWLGATICKQEALEDNDLELFVQDWQLLSGTGCPTSDILILFKKIRAKFRCLVEEDNPFLVSVSRSNKILTADSHVYLVLSKELHHLPWEILECLSSHSVSRVPSMSVLADLFQRNSAMCDIIISTEAPISYILNPSGDLIKTAEYFSPKFKELKSLAIGCINEIPSQSFYNNVFSSALFLYFGHGTGDQYLHIRKQLKKPEHKKSPVYFMMGCSSGALQRKGSFPAFGPPWDYLLAGSPCIVANLWDVTDRDIDRFSLATLTKIGIFEEDYVTSKKNISQCNVAEAVRLSRSACLLPRLVGAAPVVFGLPIKFRYA
jgi:Peptidase family C50